MAEQDTIVREWYSTNELARKFGMSPATIRKWRVTNVGPVGTRMGKHVRYHKDDVEAWVRARREDAVS